MFWVLALAPIALALAIGAWRGKAFSRVAFLGLIGVAVVAYDLAFETVPKVTAALAPVAFFSGLGAAGFAGPALIKNIYGAAAISAAAAAVAAYPLVHLVLWYACVGGGGCV